MKLVPASRYVTFDLPHCKTRMSHDSKACPFRALIHAAFPWISLSARTALSTLLDDIERPNTDVRRPAAVTRRLTRALQAEGLPAVRELTGWLRVIHAVTEWEQLGCSLCAQALAAAEDPANWYRLVRRRTGRSWTETRRLGSAVMVLELLRQCTVPIRVSAPREVMAPSRRA